MNEARKAPAEELKEYTRYLRNAAPDAFTNFVAAFDNYAGSRIYRLVYAAEDLQLVQGHARECVELKKMFEEISRG